jgi:voltage-gated potassium channel
MFLFKIIFLGLFAILVQYYQTDDRINSLYYANEMKQILISLWLIFAIERFLYLSLCPNKTWRSFVAAFFIVLFPPLHLAARRCHTKQYIWYFTHWELVREELFNKIERQFLFWIILILVIMTPFWLIELIFSKKLHDNILLQHIMNTGNAIVWAVFVAELVIEISITKKWQQYLIKHWIELLIILLPMLAFARFLRFAKLGFLAKFGFIQKMVITYTAKWQKLLNIYRARSTVNRLIRIFILVEVIQRWQQSRNPKKYLKKLHEQLEEKQQELDEIKRKIAETEKLVIK